MNFDVVGPSLVPGAVEELARFLESAGVDPDLVRAEARKGDLVQAASYGLDRLTKQQMGEFIWSPCRCGTAWPEEIHRNIVNLGPRDYVTTNYDDLIEQSLRKWHESRPFRTVINRHLTETAAIARTHASDYVFKPHGDAGDMDSIIMSREQYRALLPQGGDAGVRQRMLQRVYRSTRFRSPNRTCKSNLCRLRRRDVHYDAVAGVND